MGGSDGGKAADRLHKLRETVKTLEGKEQPERFRSQITLAKRRMRAFSLAVRLIERELAENSRPVLEPV